MQKIALSICLLVLTVMLSLAQEGQVSGKVFAFKDTPVANIKVTAKKSKKTTTTNMRGEFSLECKADDKLVFEGSGFKKLVKRVTAGEQLNIKMLFLEGERNAEVAIGSGHLTRESLTYATSNFLEYNNDYHTYPDIFTLIAGKFPGVRIENVLGEKRIIIRDIQYFSNDGNNTALYLVDGQIWQDISVLRPEEIKAINVMKDGAPMGFRGANGVVLITTVDEYGKVKFPERDND
ncbi:carboxypeptidase-like regulatory domain-containing protein [Roseivirga thermotolerans]|nr:carboxypeptidase-like regulatory domain-containing protein [Roseivirga thermotolerans]